MYRYIIGDTASIGLTYCALSTSKDSTSTRQRLVIRLRKMAASLRVRPSGATTPKATGNLTASYDMIRNVSVSLDMLLTTWNR